MQVQSSGVPIEEFSSPNLQMCNKSPAVGRELWPVGCGLWGRTVVHNDEKHQGSLHALIEPETKNVMPKGQDEHDSDG